MDSIDKFVHRQLNKPKIKGVHTAIMPRDQGTSIAGSYHGKYGSNQQTSKRIHSEVYRDLVLMKKPNLP